MLTLNILHKVLEKQLKICPPHALLPYVEATHKGKLGASCLCSINSDTTNAILGIPNLEDAQRSAGVQKEDCADSKNCCLDWK